MEVVARSDGVVVCSQEDGPLQALSACFVFFRRGVIIAMIYSSNPEIAVRTLIGDSLSRETQTSACYR